MKIKIEDATKRIAGDGLTIYELYKKNHIEFTIAEINGKNTFLNAEEGERLYYFLEGEAFVSIGEEVFSCRKDDIVVIPENTEYGIAGKAKYIRIAPTADI